LGKAVVVTLIVLAGLVELVVLEVFIVADPEI
jgi:hypothetical protein